MVPGRRAKSQIEAGSRRPPDEKHPFGYGRIEYFSAIAIAALVLAAGAGSLVESIKKIVHPETPEYGAAALVIVAVRNRAALRDALVAELAPRFPGRTLPLNFDTDYSD